MPSPTKEEDEKAYSYALFFVFPFPETERDAATSIKILLLQMGLYVVDFMAALDLYTYCERSFSKAKQYGDIGAARGYARQAYVPARDGAMTIYHFGCALQKIRGRMHLCRAMRKRVFHDEIRAAYRLFAKRFPHWEELRHTVAHAADEAAKITMADIQADAYEFPRVGSRIFSVTRDGKKISYDITDESLDLLQEVKVAVFNAFRQVDADATVALMKGDILSC